MKKREIKSTTSKDKPESAPVLESFEARATHQRLKRMTEKTISIYKDLF